MKISRKLTHPVLRLLKQPLIMSVLGLVLCAAESKAVSLFYDDFETNAYTGGTPRWMANRDDGTQVLTPGPFVAPYYTNWLTGGGPNNNGYIFVQHRSDGAASDYLLHTNTANNLNISPEAVAYESLYVSWDQSHTAADAATRYLSVQVDGEWYVANAQNAFASSNQRIMDLRTTVWNPLSVVTGAGGQLTVDSSTSKTYAELFGTGDSISSLGFYLEMPAGNGALRTVRWDNLMMTSGLLWRGGDGLGGSGTWGTAGTWATGPAGSLVNANWADHQTALFGGEGMTGGATVTLGTNVTARGLEFQSGANGYVLRGTSTTSTDAGRTILTFNTAVADRSIYLAPNTAVTFGGDAATYLGVYKAGLMQVYGGGSLVVDTNAWLRTTAGTGNHMVVNDGAEVTVKAGGQFHASDSLYIGNHLSTSATGSGDASLIVDGGDVQIGTGGGARNLVIGGPSGSASVTVKNTGVITTHTSSALGVVFGGLGELNLESGGVLNTRKIGKAVDSNGEATLRFNGGKLVVNAVPAAGTGNLIGTDLDHVYVAAGGATIDTNGNNATISTAFTHDPNTVGADGGFVKTGAGTLTMDVTNVYTGATIIRGGTLQSNTFGVLGNPATNDASNFVLDGGTFALTLGGVVTQRQIQITANGGRLRATATGWRVNGQIHAAEDTVLTIDGPVWLSADNSTTFDGEINVVAGEFLVRRSASLGSTLGGVAVRSGATFSLDHNGTGGGDNVSTDNTYNDELTLEQNATLRTRGKGVTTSAASIYAGAVHLATTGTGGAASVVNVSNQDGTTTQIPDMTITGLIDGAGGLHKTGGGKLILTYQNTYTGATTVSAGTLLVNSTHTGAGSYTVTETGAKLGGTGSITGTPASSITLGANSYLMVGTNHGAVAGNNAAQQFSLTTTTTGDIDLAGTLQFDLYDSDTGIIGTENDLLLLNGATAADLILTGNIELAFGFGASTAWADGDRWKLIDWTNVTGTVDTAQLDLLTTQLNGFNLTTETINDSGASNGFYIIATAVPEPSRALLLLVGFAALFLRRRRA